MRIIPLLIMLFLASCIGKLDKDNPNLNKEASEPKPKIKIDSLQLDTETKFIIGKNDTGNGYFNLINPVVFSNTASLYATSTENSEIVTKLKFNAPLIIENPNDYWGEFYTINYGNKKAYISASNVASHKIDVTVKDKKYTYYFITHYSKKYNPNKNGFTIYKYDRERKQFVDTFSLADSRADIVYQVNNAAWANSDIIFYTQEINAYCGGGTHENYIIEANGHFNILFKTYTYADDAEAPQVNYSTISFPKNVTNDTIRFHKVSPVEVKNKKGKAIILKDGSPKVESIDSISFYKWNGSSLILLGQKAVKKQ